MSLDVSLVGLKTTVECTCPHCENVHTKEDRPTYFDANITHNLGKMADAAGIYQHLWRPEELGIQRASELILPLKEGLARLRARPDYYRTLEPKNRWGTYENFIPWIEEYIKACEEYPDASVEVSG